VAKRAKAPQIAEKVDTRHRMRYNAGMERFISASKKLMGTTIGFVLGLAISAAAVLLFVALFRIAVKVIFSVNL
jgi:hypothetical protein